MKKIIELENVSFSYFKSEKTLEDVNLTVYNKDFLGIIGPNGGGKSTLLKLILGLLKQDSGKIKLFGLNPKKGRKFLGYVPQYFAFDFQFPMTVLDVVLMGRLVKRGLGKKFVKQDYDIAYEALEKTGMLEFKSSQIGELSGGQRQRILISRALCSKPRALILDEPVSGLDSAWQSSFYNLLKELNKKIGIIIVSHNIGFISSYVKTIACLNKTLHYHGNPKEGIEHLSKSYKCPVEMVAHGVPHRVLGEHK
ncbi:MAG: metal ABC transporter ATP-binding protein [Nanobdellota archaeon]